MSGIDVQRELLHIAGGIGFREIIYGILFIEIANDTTAEGLSTLFEAAICRIEGFIGPLTIQNGIGPPGLDQQMGIWDTERDGGDEIGFGKTSLLHILI